MLSSGNNMSVEKLNELNYESWKTHMKSVLILHDLWSYVDGTETEPEVEAQKWRKKDAKALAMINLSVSPNLLNHTKNAETSKEAWDALKRVFESTGPIRVLTPFVPFHLTEAKPRGKYIDDSWNSNSKDQKI